MAVNRITNTTAITVVLYVLTSAVWAKTVYAVEPSTVFQGPCMESLTLMETYVSDVISGGSVDEILQKYFHKDLANSIRNKYEELFETSALNDIADLRFKLLFPL